MIGKYYRVELHLRNAPSETIFDGDAVDPIAAACILWLWAQMEGWGSSGFEIWSASPLKVHRCHSMEAALNESFDLVNETGN